MTSLARALTSLALLAALACSEPIVAKPQAKEEAPAPPAPAAHPPPAAPDEPQRTTARVTIATPDGPRAFRVEIADDNKERARGLMHRTQMDEDAGMLFLFDRMKVQSFWMKNTRIPLDMLFIDDAGVIVGIAENAEPMTLTSRSVGKPSRYVLELNAGTSRRRGLAAGQRVTFEGVPGHPVKAAAR